MAFCESSYLGAPDTQPGDTCRVEENGLKFVLHLSIMTQVSTHLKNISQIGNPQIGVKIRKYLKPFVTICRTCRASTRARHFSLGTCGHFTNPSMKPALSPNHQDGPPDGHTTAELPYQSDQAYVEAMVISSTYTNTAEHLNVA